MHTTLLIVLYVACELIANVTANKPVDVAGLSAPGGVFIYALTFTLIDLINDRMGKGGARRVVVAALAANVLFAFYIRVVIALPSPAFYNGSEHFASVLGSTWRIVVASIVAYIVSSLIDVEIFDWWKRKGRGPAWMRVLMSNGVSTLIDSVTFVVLAFAGTFPLLGLILGQYIFKMIMTVVSMPLIYATRQRASTPE
jgi:queuosine precursor transporter